MSGLDDTSFTVRSTTATTDTLTANDYIVLYTAATAKAVTVPSGALTIPGRIYVVVNEGAGAVTLTPAVGLVDGGATQTVAAGATGAYHGRTIVNDGVNWVTTDSF